MKITIKEIHINENGTKNGGEMTPDEKGMIARQMNAEAVCKTLCAYGYKAKVAGLAHDRVHVKVGDTSSTFEQTGKIWRVMTGMEHGIILKDIEAIDEYIKVRSNGPLNIEDPGIVQFFVEDVGWYKFEQIGLEYVIEKDGHCFGCPVCDKVNFYPDGLIRCMVTNEQGEEIACILEKRCVKLYIGDKKVELSKTPKYAEEYFR